jgi:menaquinone-dependent protoporphyrinogen oxidase
VAGALLYTQYGLLKRFIMKLIVKRQGGSTDTSVDHEYTDWAALQRFVDEFMTSAVEPLATTSSPN